MFKYLDSGSIDGAFKENDECKIDAKVKTSFQNKIFSFIIVG
jgi:hypothetical protein